MNEGSGTIHPFWRAVVGATFGLGIGVVWAAAGFWAALAAGVLVILGGVLGVLLISGD